MADEIVSRGGAHAVVEEGAICRRGRLFVDEKVVPFVEVEVEV